VALRAEPPIDDLDIDVQNPGSEKLVEISSPKPGS
jgi:hypothetical protein